jgi:integrase
VPTQLPSGRWRTRVRHPRLGKQVSAQSVIGGPDTYPDRQSAQDAEREAAKVLSSRAEVGVTVANWWHEWVTDPLWRRPSASTNLHYRERTEQFARAYADRPIRSIDDLVVREWIRGGRNLGTVPSLRAMFNDAASAAAGRLVDLNPFAGLRLPGSRGRADTRPPSQADLARLLAIADEITPPSFAGYLHCAAHLGMRPGELDALEWADVDFQAETVSVERQWVAKTSSFELPKHRHARVIALTDPARLRMLSIAQESAWVFTTLRGHHYTPSTRNHHWNRVRCAAGMPDLDLYLATRHYFASYALNVLRLPEHVIAHQLGHRDGGALVRKVYGHSDHALALDRVRDAYRSAPEAPVPLRRAS